MVKNETTYSINIILLLPHVIIKNKKNLLNNKHFSIMNINKAF